ncbi:unnamed protein product [Linum trigynum]|uniref:Uncharacterized protein n=2 Tax=Linum trigynum TaxID=586398 RepID=A0AAV2EYG6_9ROSI
MVSTKSMTAAEKAAQAAQEKATTGGVAGKTNDGEEETNAAAMSPKPTQADTAPPKTAQVRQPPLEATKGRQEDVVVDVTDEEDFRTLLKNVLVGHTRDQEARQEDSREIWQAIRELREFMMQQQGQPPP